ncbi:MAG TPA: DUF1634 domain-containing protein [Desulfobaccales bacterium]|jgi:uncharacterized membrane protein
MSYPQPWNDQQMDRIIGMILRVGVLISALVVLTGGFFYLRHYGFNVPEYGIFQGEPADLRNISGILQDTLAFRARGIIQFGLLLLIATPVVRVSFSIIGFALQRDKAYVMVTLIVLALLLFSITGGGR